jgi:arabinofuranosyltransferase
VARYARDMAAHPGTTESPPQGDDGLLASGLGNGQRSGGPHSRPGAGPLREGRLVRGWNGAVLVLPVLAVLVLGYRRRWLADDGLIFTRTVREILAGHGPVFSPGERAEASTSTLWQWFLALGSGVTRVAPDRFAVYSGLLLTAVGVLVALDATRRLVRLYSGEASVVLLPAGIVAVLVLRPAWDYATSGLETGLTICWLAIAWRLLVGVRPSASRRALLICAFVLGLAPLVRPDMLLVGAAFLVAGWLLAGRPGWRTSALALVCAGALPLVYEIFRMGYYGLLVPMPALTKEAGASDWARGGRYLQDFLGDSHLWLGVLLVGLTLGAVSVGIRRSTGTRSTGTRSAGISSPPPSETGAGVAVDTRRRATVLFAVPVVTGLLMTAYVTRVGGDWMRARMLLPALFVLVLPVLVVPATRLLWPCALVLVAWGGLALASPPGRDVPSAVHPEIRSIDARALTVQLTGNPHPDRASDLVHAFPNYLAAVRSAVAGHRSELLVYSDRFADDHLYGVPLAQPGDRPVVVGSYLGAAGATAPLDVRVVDQLSLAYPLGAHLVLQRWYLPGHEKLVSDSWMIADYAQPGRLPDAPQTPDVTPASIAAARHALSCGDLKELQDSVRQPMTVGRFVRNLVGAPHRTSLRVPRDPFVAERTFCR